jgi:hypothetical protein
MILPLSVKTLDDYKLIIKFSTGEEKVYDAKSDIAHGVFQSLRDKSFFASARIARGTVVWNDDLDIAPETLYQDSKPI